MRDQKSVARHLLEILLGLPCQVLLALIPFPLDLELETTLKSKLVMDLAGPGAAFSHLRQWCGS